MKKLLLASTVLVASAGVAAADVSLSGDGRMGIVYNSGPGNNFMFTSRARVTFTLSGETSTGLAFGGSFRADNADDASDGTGGSVFISGEFGTLTMGDTDGAAQFIIGNVAGVGLTGLGDQNENVWLGNAAGVGGTDVARPTARYDYSIDGFSVAVSHTNPGSDVTVAAIAAGYEFEGFSVGLGFEQSNGLPGSATLPNAQHIIVGVGYELDGIGFQANYGQLNSSFVNALPNQNVNRNQYSLAVTGSFDEVGVTAYYARSFGGATSYGIGGSYDLGGGAELVGGIVSTNQSTATGPASNLGVPMLTPADANRRTTADFGISFSF